MTPDLDEYDLAYEQRQQRRAEAVTQSEIAAKTAEQEITRPRRRTSWATAAEIRVALGMVADLTEQIRSRPEPPPWAPEICGGDGRAKLDETKVRQIREMATTHTRAEIARLTGMSWGAISKVCTGQSWRSAITRIVRGQSWRQRDQIIPETA